MTQTNQTEAARLILARVERIGERVRHNMESTPTQRVELAHDLESLLGLATELDSTVDQTWANVAIRNLYA